MHRVFVYGTLKRGFPNDISEANGFHWLGPFRTIEAFPLVVGGRWFSPYLIAEPDEGHRVLGEVFEVDDQGLRELDRMEGTEVANGYRRIRLAIESEDKSTAFDAWTYVKDREMIEGVYSEPMIEYELDPKYVHPAKRTSDF